MCLTLTWVPEAFLAYDGNFRCSPKADTSSAVGRSALEKSLAPRAILHKSCVKLYANLLFVRAYMIFSKLNQ